MKVDVNGIEQLRQHLIQIVNLLSDMKKQEREYWETWRQSKIKEASVQPSTIVFGPVDILFKEGARTAVLDAVMPYSAKRITALRPIIAYDETADFGKQVTMEIGSVDMIIPPISFIVPPVEDHKVNWYLKYENTRFALFAQSIEKSTFKAKIGLMVYYES